MKYIRACLALIAAVCLAASMVITCFSATVRIPKANGIAFLLNCGFEKAFIHIDPKIAKVQHLNLIIYKKFTNEAHLKLFLSTNPCFGGILLFG